MSIHPASKKMEPKNRTLGPVADLEKHLPADWWKSLFNSVYIKTDGDVYENDTNTKKDIDLLIKAADLKRGDRILDLCCGQGRHTIELHKKGYTNTIGIDRSKYLVRLARKRATEQSFDIRFREGDARFIRLPESSLDCVVLFGNSFGYFESKDEDLKVIHSIIKALKSQGTLVLDNLNGEWMRNNFEARTWEWIDGNHFVCRERSLSNDASKIISREVVVHAEKGVIADQFYAERLYSFSDIKSILEELKFTDIKLHENILTESTRSQDLGMMANRLFITAKAPIKSAPALKAVPTKNCVVLMGDPKLPDTVKKDGKFNEEDFVTINKLKEAINRLPYKAKYFDDHDKIIDFLRKEKPSFVINLCDEGYNNKATYELHIPALLDILNIKYTGAGPATLALCYDKSVVRSIAMAMDIPVPLETYFSTNDQAANLPSIFPALIKPNFGDSSIGITKEAVVHDSTSLIAYLDNLKLTLPNTPLLVQEYLPGTEYTVGIIGNPGNYTYLPILSVDYSEIPDNLPKILGYESKWLPDSVYWQNIKYKQANLDLETERKLFDYSTLLFERLNCQDYARFDFRTDAEGEIKLLEVNPNPGWCWDGKMNLMASLDGKSYSDLLDLIIKAALERHML